MDIIVGWFAVWSDFINSHASILQTIAYLSVIWLIFCEISDGLLQLISRVLLAIFAKKNIMWVAIIAAVLSIFILIIPNMPSTPSLIGSIALVFVAAVICLEKNYPKKP